MGGGGGGGGRSVRPGWGTAAGAGCPVAGVLQRPGPLLVRVEAGVPGLDEWSRCSWLDALEPTEELGFIHRSLSDLRSIMASTRWCSR